MSRRVETASELLRDAHNDSLEPTIASGNVTEANVTGSQQKAIDAPLPRPKRSPRRPTADRGLPPDDDLRALAEHYFNQQRALWPNLAASGLLSVPSEAVLAQMVEDFKHRHRTGQVEAAAVADCRRSVRFLGGAYSRYSCDNSSSNSILDQLTNSLRKARTEERFIPWQYVFADYAVTGLDATRVGYSSYKSVLKDPDQGIETTYIDDFTRASRNEIEWWQLASMSKRLGKRLVGASDGFNLHDPNSDLLITMYGLVSRLQIKSLREKVHRGMRGAVSRGTVVGQLPLGFTRCPLTDGQDRAVLRPDGRPRHVPCIEPETAQFRVRMYELFVEQGWSPGKIAREFNRLEVDSSRGWTRSAISKLLWSPSAIGVFIWNRTRRERDETTGKWIKVPNPCSEWQIHYDPKLALVPRDLWRQARRKLGAIRRQSPLTGRPPSLNQRFASTLFSGTLFCASCQDQGAPGAELKLLRSAGKYQQMGCLNGRSGAHGCPLSASKSVTVIEESLLEFLKNSLLTPERIADLVQRANACLKQEAEKPIAATGALKSRIRKIERLIKGFVQRVEEKLGDPVCEVYEKRIRELKGDLRPVQEELRQAEQQNRKREIAPLAAEQVIGYLGDLRSLLNQAIPVAADAIRALTGPIRIRQERIPGQKRGAKWIATFTPELIRLLRKFANDRELPESRTLQQIDWSADDTVEVEIRRIPRYEQLAPEFQRLHDSGASLQTIAAAYGITWKSAREILEFAETGCRPQWKAGRRTGNGGCVKYLAIREQVAELRDRQKLSFRKIAKQLQVGVATVRRAYDEAHRSEAQVAAERGQTPRRGRYTHLGEPVYRRIRQGIRKGLKDEEIAAAVGCGSNTVRRERKRLRSQRDRA